MKKISRLVSVQLLLFTTILLQGVTVATAATPEELQQAMSDTLDLWRDGHYEQMFETLSHRGKTSKEQFVKKMRGAEIRPACCWQKIENFKVLNEKRTEATVYAKVGLEGSTPNTPESSTREFKLSHDSESWKMQMNDIVALSGITVKKKAAKKHKKHQ